MKTCHQCGIQVPANCGVHRSVNTGVGLGTIVQVNYQDVFLCAPCAEQHDKSKNNVFKLWAYVIGALVVIYALGSLAG